MYPARQSCFPAWMLHWTLSVNQFLYKCLVHHHSHAANMRLQYNTGHQTFMRTKRVFYLLIL